jgi:hypothetical protein
MIQRAQVSVSDSNALIAMYFSGVPLLLELMLLAMTEIYLKGKLCTSTESCNFFPSLLWELSRQNYLAVASVWLFTVVVVRKYPVVGSEAKAERVAEM